MFHLPYFLRNLFFGSAMTETPQKLFTDQVIKDVRTSWNSINGALQLVGYEVFDRLFATFPEYQQMFRAFKNVPTSELRKNKEYNHHALNVAKALDSMIENLENTETLVNILTKIGKNHVKRNVTAAHYKNVQKIIFEALSGALGEKFEPIAESWNEVLTVAISTITKATLEEEAKYI